MTWTRRRAWLGLRAGGGDPNSLSRTVDRKLDTCGQRVETGDIGVCPCQPLEKFRLLGGIVVGSHRCAHGVEVLAQFMALVPSS